MRRIALGWLRLGIVALAACGPRHGAGRIEAAKPVRELPIKVLCRQDGVPYPPKHIFLRAFKQERQLELWGAGTGGKMHLHTYAIAAASGAPGPKRREGDSSRARWPRGGRKCRNDKWEPGGL
ncbi:MAG TPA: hypothetical protein VHE55_01140 [Fimbriimonadaceae bacterium]|nr:hypothetical protein [Fimbriimonadaceae bacterium]